MTARSQLESLLQVEIAHLYRIGIL
jgi:hypothetical protein